MGICPDISRLEQQRKNQNPKYKENLKQYQALCETSLHQYCSLNPELMIKLFQNTAGERTQ